MIQTLIFGSAFVECYRLLSLVLLIYVFISPNYMMSIHEIYTIYINKLIIYIDYNINCIRKYVQ